MTTISRRDFTRRGALATLGASAAVASGATLAATSETPLRLADVELAWPVYHHLAAVKDAPVIGERVALRREPGEPYMRGAIAAYSERGQRLGYIGRTHAEALATAMDRGEVTVEAWVARLTTPMSAAPPQRGWSVLSLDLRVGPALV